MYNLVGPLSGGWRAEKERGREAHPRRPPECQLWPNPGAGFPQVQAIGLGLFSGLIVSVEGGMEWGRGRVLPAAYRLGLFGGSARPHRSG